MSVGIDADIDVDAVFDVRVDVDVDYVGVDDDVDEHVDVGADVGADADDNDVDNDVGKMFIVLCCMLLPANTPLKHLLGVSAGVRTVYTDCSSGVDLNNK